MMNHKSKLGPTKPSGGPRGQGQLGAGSDIRHREAVALSGGSRHPGPPERRLGDGVGPGGVGAGGYAC
jgi:hypothetical protein